MPTPEEDPRGYAERRGWKVLESRWDGSAHLLLVEERPDLAEAFEELRLDLKGEPGEVRLHPMLRRAGGELLLVLLPQTRRKTRSERTNLYLLLATIFTTTWAGTLFWAGYAGSYELRSGWDLLLILLHPETLFYGWLTFSLPLLTILGIHEMGHYVYARKHNLDASLPFFIPIPPPLLLGTMGAFIAIREPIPNRRALLDVGASGPIAGFLAALPITLLGFWLTEQAAREAPVDPGNLIFLGTPLAFNLLGALAEQFMTLSDNYLIHPVAFAGWAGLLVTALNLLPAGQLDGGHIARALLGPRAQMLSYLAIAVMLFMAFWGVPGYSDPYFGWAIFAGLVYFLGAEHPPPSEEITPLGTPRWLAGGFTGVMLLLCFVPSPLMTIPSPFGLEMEAADGELGFEAGGSNVTLIWVNNTGEVHDNLSLALKLPAGWSASLSVTNVTVPDGKWLNPGNTTFGEVAWQPDPFNLSLNLTAGASAQLRLELSAPAEFSEPVQALLEASSRNEATYTLRLSLLPEAEA